MGGGEGEGEGGGESMEESGGGALFFSFLQAPMALVMSLAIKNEFLPTLLLSKGRVEI